MRSLTLLARPMSGARRRPIGRTRVHNTPCVRWSRTACAGPARRVRVRHAACWSGTRAAPVPGAGPGEPPDLCKPPGGTSTRCGFLHVPQAGVPILLVPPMAKDYTSFVSFASEALLEHVNPMAAICNAMGLCGSQPPPPDKKDVVDAVSEALVLLSALAR